MSRTHQKDTSVFPPADPSSEPTDANPVPLSPTNPTHRTGQGDETPPTAARPGIVAIPLPRNSSGSGVPAQAIPVADDAQTTREDPRVRPDSEGAV